MRVCTVCFREESVDTAPGLTIRGLRGDDWESLFPLWNMEEVLLNSLHLPYIGEDVFRDRINTPAAGTHVLIAEVSQPSGRKQVAGAAWLSVQRDRRRHMARLTHIMHPDYAGGDVEYGLLRAALNLADNWLGLRRVEINVFTNQSAAMYEQLGFVTEATMHRAALRAGVYHDVYLMARLYAGREQHGG